MPPPKKETIWKLETILNMKSIFNEKVHSYHSMSDLRSKKSPKFLDINAPEHPF